MARLVTSVVVLAGGGSSRFGSPKALVQWRGKRLIDHVIERLGPFGDTTILVTNPLPEEPVWPVLSACSGQLAANRSCSADSILFLPAASCQLNFRLARPSVSLERFALDPLTP